MILKSFGCSFIYGNELSDISANSSSASQLTWPALLAQQHGLTYQCHAEPGSGNLRILNNVLSEVAKNEKSFFVIGWTWASRFDYVDVAEIQETWKTLTPASNNKLTEYFYKIFNSQTHDKLQSLIYIKTAIEALQQRQIPFIMTAMESMIFETQWHSTAAIQLLQHSVLPCVTTFEQKNFLDWSRSKNFAVSDLWHPLDQAHRSAADYMSTIFDKQSKDALVQQALF